MAYNKFTLEKVAEQFGIIIKTTDRFFNDLPKPVVSDLLTKILERNLPMARAGASEKALSELLVSPVLMELLDLKKRQISIFSGIELNVDASKGLNGRCDFILSLSDNQYFLTTPIIALVEAKKNDISLGLGQCVAEMIASQIFNEKKGNPQKRVFGVVTTGIDWQVLSLEDKTVTIEDRIHSISNIDELLGLLVKMLESN